MNHEETENVLQRIPKFIPFISEYNWKGINHPSAKDDWKDVETNNLTIALNALHFINEYISCQHFKKKHKQLKSNHSFNGSKQRTIALSLH